MDAIAEAAHVSKQTLYRYYQNKEALFVATLRQLALAKQSANAGKSQAAKGAPHCGSTPLCAIALQGHSTL